jgi:hypothetical protein
MIPIAIATWFVLACLSTYCLCAIAKRSDEAAEHLSIQIKEGTDGDNI